MLVVACLTFMSCEFVHYFCAYFQNAIISWHKAISEGTFCCPVPSCLKAFFVMPHFVRHLRKESEYEKEFFTKVCDLKCPYCQKQSRWELFARHIQNYHRSVSILNA